MEQTAQDFVAVVSRVRRHDDAAVETLYGLLFGFRKRLMRQLGVFDGEEGFHTGFIALLDLIYDDKLEKPDRLIAVANTIFHRQYCQTVRQRVRDRSRHVQLSPSLPDRPRGDQPLEHVEKQQQIELMRQAVGQLPEKWKELIVRFYLDGESKEEICGAMRLTENQFRLNKSRAKMRLLAAVSKRSAAKHSTEPCVRFS